MRARTRIDAVRVHARLNPGAAILHKDSESNVRAGDTVRRDAPRCRSCALIGPVRGAVLVSAALRHDW